MRHFCTIYRAVHELRCREENKWRLYHNPPLRLLWGILVYAAVHTAGDRYENSTIIHSCYGDSFIGICTLTRHYACTTQHLFFPPRNLFILILCFSESVHICQNRNELSNYWELLRNCLEVCCFWNKQVGTEVDRLWKNKTKRIVTLLTVAQLFGSLLLFLKRTGGIRVGGCVQSRSVLASFFARCSHTTSQPVQPRWLGWPATELIRSSRNKKQQYIFLLATTTSASKQHISSLFN